MINFDQGRLRGGDPNTYLEPPRLDSLEPLSLRQSRLHFRHRRMRSTLRSPPPTTSNNYFVPSAANPKMLQTLPTELIIMILWNEVLEIPDLYYLRFACRAIAAAAPFVLFKRVQWLATEEKDSFCLLSELESTRNGSDSRLGGAADAFRRARPLPLPAFSTGRLFLSSDVPLNCLIAPQLFQELEAEGIGQILRGWRPHHKDIKLLLELLSRDQEFPVELVPETMNLDEDDFDPEARMLDPFTVILRCSGLPLDEMIKAIPSLEPLDFTRYFRVVWELEGFPEHANWSAETALAQLPRVLARAKMLAPRLQGIIRREPPNCLVADAYALFPDTAVAAVLNSLTTSWNARGQLAGRARPGNRSVADIARVLFAPGGDAKSAEDCTYFFVGIFAYNARFRFAVSLLENKQWPRLFKWQIWDFVPPSYPDALDEDLGTQYWDYVICGTAAAHSTRLATYFEKLLDAARDPWLRRMRQSILRHFHLYKPEPREIRYTGYTVPQTTNIHRIRAVAAAVGPVVESIALVLLTRASRESDGLAPSFAPTLVELLDKACVELLDCKAAYLSAEDAMLLIGALQTGVLLDPDSITLSKRSHLVAIVSEHVDKGWDCARQNIKVEEAS